MKHGSLFSGIGGFDLASEWMGWENVFHCEWNDFGKKVLKYYWPKSISYDDITKTNFTIHRGGIDILTGGFPCQPYSTAGKRLGKEDERHLWPEMLRAIREIQPRWIVGENVLGLVNWNGGLVFEEVQADLENEGYEVQPFVLPAVSVNAPHRRDRVWFVAYSHGARSRDNDRANDEEEREVRGQNKGNVSTKFCSNGDATNTDKGSNELQTKTGLGMDGALLEKRKRAKEANGFNCNNQSNDLPRDATNTDSSRPETLNHKESILGQKNRTKTFSRNSIESIHTRKWWESFPSVAPICDGNDGLSNRLDGITFSKWRNESIKAGGNAIVPQVVLQIFKAIERYELD
jgi:DNA (cytosine-5)-methyltransferase 1